MSKSSSPWLPTTVSWKFQPSWMWQDPSSTKFGKNSCLARWHLWWGGRSTASSQISSECLILSRSCKPSWVMTQESRWGPLLKSSRSQSQLSGLRCMRTWGTISTTWAASNSCPIKLGITVCSGPKGCWAPWRAWNDLFFPLYPQTDKLRPRPKG